MTYPFTPEQLCLLSLARMTWSRRASAKRHRLFFGEETLTETILMDLAVQYPGNVFIQPFNKADEAKTGADWAWAFESADRSYVLPMLVQAKALNLRDTHYPDIKRKIGRSLPRIRQIDQLIATANSWGWPAIYAFYNHLNDISRVPQRCNSLRMVGHPSMPDSWGISVALANNVRMALDDQSFKTHRNHSIALHCLLCSSGSAIRGPAGSPGRALEALRNLRGLGRTLLSPDDSPPLPEAPFRELPDIFRQAQEAASSPDPRKRDSQIAVLRQEFSNLAGVVILSDAKVQPS